MSDEPLHDILAHKGHVNDVEFSPDGRFLVSAGRDGLVKLWRSGEWELFSTFFGHRKSANTLSFDPDGSILATSSTDGTVRIWSFPFGREERTEKGLGSALIGPDGATVASLERKDLIRLWSLEDDEPGERLVHDHRVTAIVFDRDGRHLLAAPAGSEMVLWRIDGDAEVAGRIPADEVAVAAARFFDGGRRLAASGHEGTVRIFDADRWEETLRIDLEAEGAFPMDVAPEGGELAVGSPNRVRIHDTEGGELRRELEIPCEGVHSLAYSPGGEWLAAAAADKRIRIWERSRDGD